MSRMPTVVEHTLCCSCLALQSSHDKVRKRPESQVGIERATYSIDVGDDPNVTNVLDVGFIMGTLGKFMGPTPCGVPQQPFSLTTAMSAHSGRDSSEQFGDASRVPCVASKKAHQQQHLSSFGE